MNFLKLCFFLNCIIILSMITTMCQNDDASWNKEVLSVEKVKFLKSYAVDNDRRKELEEFWKKYKHNEKYIIRSTTSFARYECALNNIKSDLEGDLYYLSVYGVRYEKEIKAQERFTNNHIYNNTIQKFFALEEQQYPPVEKYNLASKRVLRYFSQAHLMISKRFPPKICLSTEEGKRYQYITTELTKYLNKQELTDTDKFNFALDVANLRHASNMFHYAIKSNLLHVFGDKVSEGKYVSFEDLLEDMNISEGFNITERSVQHVNILRKFKYHQVGADANYVPIKLYYARSTKGNIISLVEYPIDRCPKVENEYHP